MATSQNWLFTDSYRWHGSWAIVITDNFREKKVSTYINLCFQITKFHLDDYVLWSYILCNHFKSPPTSFPNVTIMNLGNLIVKFQHIIALIILLFERILKKNKWFSNYRSANNCFPAWTDKRDYLCHLLEMFSLTVYVAVPKV